MGLAEQGHAPPKVQLVVRSSGSAIEGRWETSQDGWKWELDFELTYRRIG